MEPFILNHSPAEFAHSTAVHFQGKADDWLKRLVPMLRSESRQSQSLAAFHFAMEAAVKNEQKNLKVSSTEMYVSLGQVFSSIYLKPYDTDTHVS